MSVKAHPTWITQIRHRVGPWLSYNRRYRLASFLSLVPVPLPLLLGLFASDKQWPGEHSYGELYERLFRSFRYRRLKLLEIGVFAGASLLTWRAYFPRAITVGFDIEDKSSFAVGNKIRIYQGDQGCAGDISRICVAEGPFDIVIDDGSHLSRHQLFSFLQLFPHIKNGGLYVIEDVQTSFWSAAVPGGDWDGCHISDPNFSKTCCGWFLDLAKYLNYQEFQTLNGADDLKIDLCSKIRRITFEHNLIVVEKGSNSEPSNLIHR